MSIPAIPAHVTPQGVTASAGHSAQHDRDGNTGAAVVNDGKAATRKTPHVPPASIIQPDAPRGSQVDVRV